MGDVKGMFDGNYYLLMAHYNQWMNKKLYSVCSGIPDSDRRKDLGAFFKSVHGTLNHLLFGDIAWMCRFKNQKHNYVIGEEIYSDFDALRKAREKKDNEILEWVGELAEEWLNSSFRFKSSVDGRTRSMPSWVLVTHMFNHQTHHRGQLTTLIKQLGYDPGVTDIPWLPILKAEP